MASPPRDRPASAAFFRQELQAALKSHAHGLGSFQVNEAPAAFGPPQASAKVQLLEGKLVEICISERGYRAESSNATNFLPANVFNKTFESLDALLPLLSSAYIEATSSELSRKLAALDDSDWMEVSVQGGNGDPMVEQEWTRMNTRYTDAGYREGIIAGKEAKLQLGFDQGFELAVPNARKLGQLRGKAAALLAYKLSRNDPVEGLRELVGDLARVKREDVLPIDHEAEAHAREEHHDDVEVADVTTGMDYLGGREHADLKQLEQRLAQYT